MAPVYGKKDIAKLALAEASGEAEDAVDFSEFGEDSDSNNEATSDQQEQGKESSTSKKSPGKGKSSKSKRSPLEEVLAPKVPAESAPVEVILHLLWLLPELRFTCLSAFALIYFGMQIVVK
jgi:hypothetical protein